MTEPFSLEEIQFIIQQRAQQAFAAGACTTRMEDVQRIARSIEEGLRYARKCGYMARIVVAVRAKVDRKMNSASLDIWGGPSDDPNRPRWAHYGQEGVSIVQT